MEKQAVPHRKMVFVCTNRREEGERKCCALGGGGILRDKLKAMVKERRLQSKIRVCASGCLDRCELGPNIMVFPDSIWYSAVREEDLPGILDELAASVQDDLVSNEGP